MNRVLIFYDSNDINCDKVVNLLDAIDQIYDDTTVETYAFCVDNQEHSILGNFDYIFRIETKIDPMDVLNIVNCIEELHKTHDFECILFPSTYVSKMLAPRLAIRLNTGLVADVTDVGITNNKVQLIRPAFDGKILASIVCKNKPVMATIRQGVFKLEKSYDKETKVIDFTLSNKIDSKVEVLCVKEKGASTDIRDSKVLVSGGGGVINDFDKLQSLATKLNCEVSASRRIIDSNIAQRSIQVGQSGKMVSPKLYIALGIYGSLQHIEGLVKVENIISINTDKHAPICSLSDIVVEGDAIEFIEKMLIRLEQ